ncbi:Lipoate-protein ligase A [subsurface metagenome]
MARRLSGGGTVYHGPGNLNFTFIMNGEKGKLVDFKKYFTPVIEFLHTKNIPAKAGNKNEIVVNGLKISGNAEHVFKNRVLHHGTLLFDSDLEILKKSVKVEQNKYIDKAVRSHRSEVSNISDFLDEMVTADTFTQDFNRFICDYFQNTSHYSFTNEEKELILALRDNKYSTWEWIYGYSPAFELKRTVVFNEHKIDIYLKVVKGIAGKVNITSESLKDMMHSLSHQLKGVKYKYEEVETLLNSEMTGKKELKDFLLANLF